jgi:hypothetical protein
VTTIPDLDSRKVRPRVVRGVRLSLMGYYTAILFSHNWFAHRGTYTISREVNTADLGKITEALIGEKSIQRRHIDTIVLLQNGKRSPEVVQVWSRSNGHFMSEEERYMVDISLQVERNMTTEERKLFLENFCAQNPHYRGAQVSDILSILCDTDAHLEVTDAMQEAHKEEVGKYPRGLYSMAVYVAIYCKMGTDWEIIRDLLQRFHKKV